MLQFVTINEEIVSPVYSIQDTRYWILDARCCPIPNLMLTLRNGYFAPGFKFNI